ncbi:hypothetical protein NEOLEDRAFT_1181862 [Neolentinus lepideus HHB14362 ss-1]|uniref:Integrase zinc-binding domain-containing protein n=1 Tax=Neolentinus lepideus HHB14362 ss-1 TaxID=1314782 RepID=A0A165PM65_9AGAM|nr:hypothetical protein NEOLEDRAFT_1181862 [Neolentinus lepideus HHB14362 ss-1]
MVIKMDARYVKGMLKNPDIAPSANDPPVNEDEEGEYEDWIDKVHGFVHFVNPVPYIVEHPSVAVYMDEVTEDSVRFVEEDQDDDYSKVPRTDKARKNDKHLVLLTEWFEKLEQPKEIPDDKYEGFVKYATRFFPTGGKLWHKNKLGTHQQVVFGNKWMTLLRQVHNDVGHHRIYVMQVLLMEHFWWPWIAQDVACGIHPGPALR